MTEGFPNLQAAFSPIYANPRMKVNLNWEDGLVPNSACRYTVALKVFGHLCNTQKYINVTAWFKQCHSSMSAAVSEYQHRKKTQSCMESYTNWEKRNCFQLLLLYKLHCKQMFFLLSICLVSLLNIFKKILKQYTFTREANWLKTLSLVCA